MGAPGALGARRSAKRRTRPPKMPNKTIVAVVGMHRSGTSVAARALMEAGVRLGDDLMPATPGENDKGFFEDLGAHRLNKGALRRAGRAWFEVHPLAETGAPLPVSPPLRARMREVLRAKTAGEGPFGFKDPRTSITLGTWRSLFRDLGLAPKIVLAARAPTECARSIARRDGFAEAHGLAMTAYHLLSALRAAADLDVLVLDYGAMIAEPDRHVAALRAFLGAPDAAPAAGFAEAFLDARLRRERAAETGAPAPFEFLDPLYGFLSARSGEALRPGEAARERVVDEAARAYGALAPLFPALNAAAREAARGPEPV